MPEHGFIDGLKVGRGSTVVAQRALDVSLGRWSRILMYIDKLSCRAELELVFNIGYFLVDEPRLTPPIKACLASDYVSSSKKILISDVEFILGGSSVKEEEGREEERTIQAS